MKNKNDNLAKSQLTFFKEQFLKSKKYKRNEDILNALLKDKFEYTEKEVNEIIENYLKGGI